MYCPKISPKLVKTLSCTVPYLTCTVQKLSCTDPILTCLYPKFTFFCWKSHHLLSNNFNWFCRIVVLYYPNFDLYCSKIDLNLSKICLDLDLLLNDPFRNNDLVYPLISTCYFPKTPWNVLVVSSFFILFKTLVSS